MEVNVLHVAAFSLIGGVMSLTGAVLMIANEKRANLLAEYATPFAAGALLAAAFVDILPETHESGDVEVGLYMAMLGIVGFFILERFLNWFHHHHEHDEAQTHRKVESNVSMIIIGDMLHNLIDGVAIAAGFLVSFESGVIVTFAVAAHEIPQEMGDFGIMLKKGMKESTVLSVNAISALLTTFTAVLFYLVGQGVELRLDMLLGLVAGFFIYIAASDIIPTIHKNEEKLFAGPQTVMLLLGVISISFITVMLHDLIQL